MTQIMTYLSKRDRQKQIAFYVIYALIISILLFVGVLSNVGASHVYRGEQYHARTKVVRHARRHRARRHNWFRDGLSNRQMRAREWVSWRESRDRWDVLSYGHKCIGRYQLSPAYLGYVHGRVNLNHAHQVHVADRYAHNRYGSWVGAQHFWARHRWY